MWCLHLNTRSHIIGGECVAKGGRSGLCITPADILRGAILAGASAIILGHNHPNGDPTPSDEDIYMTKVVAAAGHTVGIHLADHIVVTAYNGYHSIVDDENTS
jgi:DNA repair protein RadC